MRYATEYSDDGDMSHRFWMKLESRTGKIIHLEDGRNQLEPPASRVFKNIIIDVLIQNSRRFQFKFLEDRLVKMFKLAGGRIVAKRVYIAIDEWILRDYYEFMLLKHLIDCLPNYIDVEKQTMSINFYTLDSLFDRGTWKNFDFGEKTELDIDDCSYLMTNNFSIGTFKELISGRYISRFSINYRLV